MHPTYKKNTVYSMYIYKVENEEFISENVIIIILKIKI